MLKGNDYKTSNRDNFEETNGYKRKRKLSLFNEDEDDESINFSIKKQFEGEQGQKVCIANFQLTPYL